MIEVVGAIAAEETPASVPVSDQPVLPGGILHGDACYKNVRIRELTGADEERLGDRRYPNGAARVTDFLAHVMTAVEDLEQEVGPEMVADMLIGDRDYLLLWLRQTTIGDRVQQVMRCPSTACGEKVDVEFLISEIQVRRVDAVLSAYEFELSRPAFGDDPQSTRGALRLPTGRDQADLARFESQGTGRTHTRLLSRIVLRLGRRTGLDEEEARQLPLAVRQEILTHLRNVNPGPDLQIEIQCPHCGSDMSYPFDLHGFFLGS